MAALVVAVVALPSCMEKEQAIDDEIDNIKPSEGHFIMKASAPGSYTAESGTKSTLDAGLICNGNTPLPEIYPDLETKASLSSEDHKTVLWDNGDRICIFSEDGNSKSYAQNQNTSGSKAAFELADGSYSYAYYPSPASSEAFVSGSTITIPGGFPEVQTLTKGSFAHDVNLMVAKEQPKGTPWQFHNAGALLKVTIAGGGVSIKDLNGNVKAVILTDLNGGKLSGDAVVTINTDGTVSSSYIADNANAKNRVCLSADSATSVSDGDSFYFLVPPGTYGGNSKGISLDVHLASGECYCFMNYNQINVTRNANVLFANNLPVNSYEAYNRTMDKFYTNIETAASEASDDDVVMLLREKFSDNSKRQPVFTVPCTFDLNGYGYRGNLFIQNTSGTFTVKDGCVWQYAGPDGNWKKENYTDGDIDGEPGATGSVFGGEVVLDNVKAAQVYTDGHPYKISNSVIFSGGLHATDDNGADVYAGCVISLVNTDGNATRPVRVHGTEMDGSAALSSRWPVFGADPDFPRSAVTAVGGDFAARKSDSTVTVEPYRPFNRGERHAPFVWTWSDKPADHFVFYVGDHQHDMQFSEIWYKFPSHYYSTAGKWQNYIEIVQGGESYYLNDISTFPTSGAAAVEGLSVVTATDTPGEDYTIPAKDVEKEKEKYLFAWIYDDGSHLSGVSTIQANEEYTFSGGPAESYGVTGTDLELNSKYVSVVYDKTASSAKWKLLQISGEPPVEPTGIDITETSETISPGGTKQLHVTVTPPGATQGAVWTSGDTGIATVNSSGLVTGVAAGTTTITATTYNGEYYDNCNVTVAANPAAQIGSTKYETLAAAASAVSNNQTITLLRNVTENVYFGRTKKDVILDLNNKVVTGQFRMLNHTGEGGGTIHIQNGTIDGTILTTEYQDFDPGWAGDGVVELTGVTVNEVITAGHSYEINSGCVISNRLYVIGWSKTTNIHDGAKVKSLSVSTGSGQYAAFAYIDGGFFGEDPSGTRVEIKPGYHIESGSGVEGYPYHLVKDPDVTVTITSGANPTFDGFTAADKTITATKSGSGGSWSCSSSNTSSATVTKGTENGNTCTFTVHPVSPGNGSASTSTITISYGAASTNTTATVNYREIDITQYLKDNIHCTYSNKVLSTNSNSSVYTNAPLLAVRPQNDGLKIYDNKYLSISSTGNYSPYGTMTWRAGNASRPENMFDTDDDNVFSTNFDVMSTGGGWTIRNQDKILYDRHFMRFDLGENVKMVKLVTKNPTHDSSDSWWGYVLSTGFGMDYYLNTSGGTSKPSQWTTVNVQTEAALGTNTYYLRKSDGSEFRYIYISPHNGRSTDWEYGGYSNDWGQVFRDVCTEEMGSFGFTRIWVHKVY